jgi:heme/copper-type cytochrome/quinol oxidase subunit 1
MNARKVSPWLALGWFAGALLLLLADIVTKIRPDVLGGGAYAYYGPYTYYVVGHRSWSLVLPAAFGIFGVLYLVALPRLPIRLRPSLGRLHLMATAAGAALIEAPQLALLAGGTLLRGKEPVAAFRVWNEIAMAGAAMMGLSLLIFIWALVNGARHRGSG